MNDGCDAPDELDTANRFLVGKLGDKLRVLALFNRPLTQAEALNLAAWLVTLSGVDRVEFFRLLDAVQNA